MDPKFTMPTSRQNEVLAEIRSYSERYKFPPTIQHLADKFRVFPNAIKQHLVLLEKKGLIKVTEGAHRGIRVI